MDEKTAKSLKTQLQAAASQIDSQAGSERAVLSAMQLLADATSKFDYSQMSDLDFQVMLRTQQKTLTSVGQFAQQLQNRPLTEKQEAEIARLKKDVGELNRQLDGETKASKDLNDELVKIQSSLRIQQSRNIRDQEKLAGAQIELQRAEQEKALLEESLKKCSPENLEKIRMENERLAMEFAKQEENKNRLETEQSGLNDQLEDLKKEISAFSEENQKLADSITALRNKLALLNNLEAECSEEHRAELEKEVADLQPKVEKLETSYKAVQKELESLRAIHDRQLADNTEAEEQFVEVFRETLDSLEGHTESLASKLQSAKERCTRFETNLNACQDEYRRYHAWMSSLVPVIDAMSEKAGLSQLEYENLYATLDPTQCESLHLLSEQIRSNLQRLDAILAAGMNAARTDQAITQKRAEESEEAANRVREEARQ